MKAIGALNRLALGIGHRFLKAAPNAVGNFAHGVLLLNALTNSAVNCRIFEDTASHSAPRRAADLPDRKIPQKKFTKCST
jgi:hypothetical protein